MRVRVVARADPRTAVGVIAGVAVHRLAAELAAADAAAGARLGAAVGGRRRLSRGRLRSGGHVDRDDRAEVEPVPLLLEHSAEAVLAPCPVHPEVPAGVIRELHQGGPFPAVLLLQEDLRSGHLVHGPGGQRERALRGHRVRRRLQRHGRRRRRLSGTRQRHRRRTKRTYGNDTNERS